MVDFKSAAVLVWMFSDETPSLESFQVSDDDMPEAYGYWELGAALIAARRSHEDDKVAWIKVENVVLPPGECEQAYNRFRSGQAF